jgi:hypothetical protein
VGGVEEEEPGPAMSVKFCARQRQLEKKMVQWRPAVKSERGAVEWRRRCFPSLPATLNLIGFRVCAVGSTAQTNLVRRAAGPHLFI